MNIKIIKGTPHEINVEKLLKWQSDRHIIGTYYSDEYLEAIRKIINSESGKLSEFN